MPRVFSRPLDHDQNQFHQRPLYRCCYPLYRYALIYYWSKEQSVLRSCAWWCLYDPIPWVWHCSRDDLSLMWSMMLRATLQNWPIHKENKHTHMELYIKYMLQYIITYLILACLFILLNKILTIEIAFWLPSILCLGIAFPLQIVFNLVDNIVN